VGGGGGLGGGGGGGLSGVCTTLFSSINIMIHSSPACLRKKNFNTYESMHARCHLELNSDYLAIFCCMKFIIKI
jgi:hypothetical protein